jgi:hypothetical protein
VINVGDLEELVILYQAEELFIGAPGRAETEARGGAGWPSIARIHHFEMELS